MKKTKVFSIHFLMKMKALLNNLKAILLCLIIPFGVILAGAILMFTGMQFASDPSAVAKTAFPIFVTVSTVMGIVPAVVIAVKAEITEDVKKSVLELCSPKSSSVPKNNGYIVISNAFAAFAAPLISMLVSCVGVAVTAMIYSGLNINEAFKYNLRTDAALSHSVMSMSFVTIGLCFLISVLAKSKKQAMIISVIAGIVLSAIGCLPAIPEIAELANGAGVTPYLIPVFNASLNLHDIMSASADKLNYLITELIAITTASILFVCASIVLAYKNKKQQ